MVEVFKPAEPSIEVRKAILSNVRKRNSNNCFIVSMLDGSLKQSLYLSDGSYPSGVPKDCYVIETNYNPFISYQELDKIIQFDIDRVSGIIHDNIADKIGFIATLEGLDGCTVKDLVETFNITQNTANKWLKCFELVKRSVLSNKVLIEEHDYTLDGIRDLRWRAFEVSFRRR